jgi:hypothetical protein
VGQVREPAVKWLSGRLVGWLIGGGSIRGEEILIL